METPAQKKREKKVERWDGAPWQSAGQAREKSSVQSPELKTNKITTTKG